MISRELVELHDLPPKLFILIKPIEPHTLKFIGRVLVISIVSDSIVSQIIEEMMRSFDMLEEPYGVLFVKDVTNAYELGTELKGDEVLVSK